MSRPYEIKNGFLNLFDYTVEGKVGYMRANSQKDYHNYSYKFANETLDGFNTQTQPAIEFLKQAADPDEIPTKEEFEKWQKKRKIVDGLK